MALRASVLSDGNDTKTKEQLLEEIAALKEQLARREALAGEPVAAASPAVDARAPEDELAAPSAPVFAAPMTRRQSIVSWVAPVILSLPVVQAVGAVIKPGTAQAQVTDDVFPLPVPTAKPTAKPTTAPTVKKAVPTAKPTAKPTATPTATPTAAATIAPTRAGRCIIAPTAAPPTTAPSAAPTIGMASTPDSRPIAGGFVPLGRARALVRGQIGQ